MYERNHITYRSYDRMAERCIGLKLLQCAVMIYHPVVVWEEIKGDIIVYGGHV